MLPIFQSIALLIRREDNRPHNTLVRVGTRHNCTIVEPFDHYHPRRDVTRENCSTATHTYETSRFDDDTYHILRCKNPVRKSTPRPCHQAQGTNDDCHRQGLKKTELRKADRTVASRSQYLGLLLNFPVGVNPFGKR